MDPDTTTEAAEAAEPVASVMPDIDNMSEAQLEALLQNQSIEIPVLDEAAVKAAQVADETSPIALIKAMSAQRPASTEAAPVASAAVTEPVAEPAAVEPVAEAVTEPVAEAAPELDNDALLAALQKRGVSVEAAQALLHPDPLAGYDFSEPAAVVAVDALAAEVEELKESILAGGDEEGLNSRDLESRRLTFTEKQAELARASDVANTAFSEARQASRAKAIELYPDVAIAGSPLSNLFAARVAAAGSNPNHPDYAVVNGAHAPLALTVQLAKELGLSPGKPAPVAVAAPVATPVAAPVAVQPPAPVARPVAPMVSGRTGTAIPVDGPDPAAQLLARVKSNDITLAELDEISGMPQGLQFAIRS